MGTKSTKRTAAPEADTVKGKRTALSAEMVEQSRDAAILWWAWAQGAILRISHDARRLAKEVERPGSPLAGLFNPEELRHFGEMLPDQTTSLSNNEPHVSIPDPLAGLPAS